MTPNIDKKRIEELKKGIVQTEVTGEMKKSYLDYAMSVIVSRAIPSIEDGLKPVQRRILYAMHQMGLKHNTQTKKSARVVGDVIGKYHPHGDSAVYEAMVRLSQDFSMRYPLVYGQGNFGSIDGDSPAAMRYTEVKLEQITVDLLADIDKETVNFVSNYDNSLKEPLLLPGKMPSLMLNGATGIAVGMATNIPPHNLGEVCDVIKEYIDNENITVEELTKVIKGPDFPTGGQIQCNTVDLFKTGKGRVIMRGKYEVEEKKNRNLIILKEIPYMVNKASLITQIANLVKDKRVRDISDLRDESNKGKIRVVIEVKKNVDPQFVVNALYKYTKFQDNFNVNFLALVGGQPKVLGLRDVLKEYVDYRKKIVTKRTQYELKKARARQEIVEGLLLALDNLDEVIKIIRFGKNPKEELVQKFKFTENQVKAILETKLRQLTSLETENLKNEEKELIKKIKSLELILGDVFEVLKIIRREVLELKEKYGDARRTQVFKRSFSEISERDLVEEKDVIVTITDRGYVKRMDVEKYRQQRRGGRGVIGSTLSTNDFAKQLLSCSTHDHLMFFTSRGRVLWLKAYDIPEAERQGKGRSIANLLGLRDEFITKVISVENFDNSLIIATKKGMVKKISLSNFSKPRSSGVRAINLPADNSDIVIGIEVIKDDQEIFLASRKGKAIRFNSSEIRSMGRASYGVTGIKLAEGDEVVSLEVLDTDAVFTITKKGYGKRTSVEDYRKTSRAGKGVINVKVSDKTGEVINTVSVNDNDNILITTAKGIVIRTSLKNIRVMGRAAQGVRVVKLQEGDKVSDVVRVLEEESH